MSEVVEEWEDDEHVLVLPGLPPNLTAPENERYVYPSSTVAFVKSMRSIDIPIVLAVPREEAVFVSHNAAELWLPILQFGAAMLAGAGGNLIATMVEKAFQKTRGPIKVHLDWRVKERNGTVHRFKFDGNPTDAAKAARAFEESVMRRDDD